MLSRKYDYAVDTSIFDKKNLEILEYIRERAYFLFNNYYPYDYFDNDYCIKVCKAFIHDFFNGKYDYNFEKFLDSSVPCDIYDDDLDCDGIVWGSYANKKVYDIELPEMISFSDCSVVIHEFIHNLFFSLSPKSCYRKDEEEIITILMEKIFAAYCYKKDFFKNNDIIDEKLEECLLINITQYENSFLECIDKDIDELLDSIFDIDNSMSHISHFIGEIYSERLFELYLENETKFTNQINGLFSGYKVDDLLTYYDVDLQDEKTINSVVKTIERIERRNFDEEDL